MTGGSMIRAALMTATVAAAAMVAGCALPKGLPGAGPTTAAIEQTNQTSAADGIQLVPITSEVARAIQARRHGSSFAQGLADGVRRGQMVGSGDALEVSVWEAPPAMLFGITNTDPRLLAGTAIVTHLPIQVVDSDGSITVPFAGRIQAAGATPRELERRIAARLRGKTNQIQVLVRIASNVSANVTVVGEVRNSTRVAVTPAGERLLDVLAAAGGVTQPVDKMTLQVTRGERMLSMPLEAIVRDPTQNVLMRPGDIVTALHQPFAFSILGAAGRNEEVPFEAKGISLAQALARAGGINDSRADRHGIFIFRYEDVSALDWGRPVATTPDGKVPVVYQLELDKPASFLIAQQFPIDHRDVLYISNAPAAELQKFLNIISSIATPVLAVRALTR